MADCRVCHGDRVVVCIAEPGVRHLVTCPACTNAGPMNELLEET